MKRFHRVPLTLLAALCFATAARADIVILKSGEKYEGRVHDVTDDSIQIEYHLTPKIKDNKTLKKSDIKEIKRQTEAEVEYQEKGFESTLPTQDLLTASDYEAIIQDRLRPFVAKYHGSPEAAKVEKMIAALDEEKSKVLSGQLKMEGKWLDANTVKREAYNIEAYRQVMLMKSKEAEANEMHYLNALRAFEKLRSTYGASPYFAMNVPNALELLKKYEAQLNTMVQEAPILIKKREEGLRSVNGQENKEVHRKIDEEVKAAKETFDRQTKEKVKWKDIYKYDVKTLKDALATVTKERAELQALDLSALAQENQQIMTIIRYLSDGNASEARAAYDRLMKQPNLINKSMMPDLQKKIVDAQKEAAAATRKEKAAVIAAPTTTTPQAEQPSTNPMAEELKRLQEAKAKKEAEAKNPSAKPAPANPGDKKPAAPGAKDNTKPATPASKPATPAAATAADESGGMMDYIPYAGGGLVIILLLAWFISKRKKDKDA